MNRTCKYAKDSYDQLCGGGSGSEYVHCTKLDIYLSNPLVNFLINKVPYRQTGEVDYVHRESGWWIFKERIRYPVARVAHPCVDCEHFKSK